jgi:REP element-mobilizing transposase RayT
MTSPSPLIYDTYYHIYNRGINRENIFFQERNYGYFLNLYAKHIEPVVETFAYCLLRNHFHILVRIKSESEINPDHPLKVSETFRVLTPSQKFSDLFNAYAKAINTAYERTGSLFQHPFGRVPKTDNYQFWSVIAYIHQNPQKHKFVEDFRDWKWSSYKTILSEMPTKLQRQAVLEWFGGRQQYLDLHSQWVSDAESQWISENDAD